MSEHTPLPWWIQEENGANYMIVVLAIYGEDSYKVGGTDDDSNLDRANAKFILRAVNSHDDLLAALEPAFERCKTSGNFRPTMDWMKMAGAAIAKAKEDSHD